MRYLTAFLTFAIGLSGAGFVSSFFDYSIDAVPEIRSDHLKPSPIESAEETPKYTSFAKSAGLFGFYGWFVADEFEGMQEVWAIQLSYHPDEAKNALVRTVPVGKGAEEQVSFVSRSLSVRDDYFGFTTEKINGVHYEFEGRFLYGGSNFEQEEKVLRGTLTKFRKGKVVATFKTIFSYAEPYCTL